jgi:glycosyltransferase involved in cell wall biosynthesis
MRILFATAHKYIPEYYGGMEINTHQLARELSKRGHSVGVLAGLKGVGVVGLRARVRMKLLGNPCPADHSLGYPTWRAWDTLTVVEEVTSIFRPDVVILQGGHNFVGLLDRLLRIGMPVVGYLHSPDRLPLDRSLQRHSHLHFVVNSNFTASLHPEKPIRAIIPPIVPKELYVTKTDRSAAVFVNPAPHKGLDTVVAMAKARPDVPFHFVINGTPTAAPPPELYPTNVRVIGPYKDMRAVYAKAKLILAPSQWEETWGRIATEAHFSGIPVLASISGGLPEAVGRGGLCMPADAPVEEWVASFGRLWDNTESYQCFVDESFKYSQRSGIQPDTIVGSLTDTLNRVRGGDAYH